VPPQPHPAIELCGARGGRLGGAITTLTTLGFNGEDEEEVNEWMLDLSRLTTLTTLWLWSCTNVKDKQVLELSHLTGLTNLNLAYCTGVTSEGLRAVQPHRTHRTQPQPLPQRHGRGAAGSDKVVTES
jgi:hypothetical protein